LKTYAQEVGLDLAAFEQCLTSGKYQAVVQQVIPLVGSLLSRPNVAARLARPLASLWGFAMMYGAVAVLLFLQALAGRPFIRV
jgi:hypothetical protein